MASTIKVNNIQNQCGANIVNKCSTTITLGASGDSIQLACGASQTGFGRTGTVDWDTTAKTAGFTAVSGNGYFVNTTSGAITMTLPASPSSGDIVAFKDYAGTFGTNNLTIGRNGSNLDGAASDKVIDTNHTSMSLVYVDGTQGWKSVEEGTGYIGESFITATGGTIVTCGDFKTHIFTGPGTFAVCSLASSPADNKVDYLVVAGGGGGGSGSNPAFQAGGGGAGGFRLSNCVGSIPAPTMSPLVNACGAITVTATSFPITVGGGGNGASSTNTPGNPGNNSVFSTITSSGGGFGAGGAGSPEAGGPGGSGGGSVVGQPAGSGNTPPVSPPQGNPGGVGYPTNSNAGGGGGGAGAAAANNSPNPCIGTPGGAGSFIAEAFIGPTSPSYGEPGPVGSTRYFAGGGGGVAYVSCAPSGGVGGGGDGGSGNPAGPACNAVTNTGGGGGGSGNGDSGNGGSGIVMIRYKYQ